MPDPASVTVDGLVDRALAMTRGGGRRILGLTGPPGAGKSTLAAQLVERLQGQAALVPMDGFHLANGELRRLGRAQRKGAPDTFDVGGFVALLARLRVERAGVVYAPRFDRELEESVGSALPVAPDVPLIITEGNYLLLDGPWAAVRGHLDEVWYLAPDPDLRRERLIVRHESHGRSSQAARHWVQSVDDENARLIEETRSRAQWVIRLDWT